jgi:membrane-bound lytic murein transglycosylase D
MFGRTLMMALTFALASCHAPIRPQEQTAPETLRPTAAAKIEARSAEAQPKQKALTEPAPPPPDVFGRLRATLGDDHCEGTPQQARWIQLYAPRPERFGERIAHMLPLFDYVLTEIEAAGLPGEFALIPIIESTYRPQARSPQGPAGMWQFTADTARNFGLEVSRDHDERLSVVDATNAALKFLGELHAQHGDWALAAAGYNAGPYRLRHAAHNARLHRQAQGLGMHAERTRQAGNRVARRRVLRTACPCVHTPTDAATGAHQ